MNPRPPESQSSALPTELRPPSKTIDLANPHKNVCGIRARHFRPCPQMPTLRGPGHTGRALTRNARSIFCRPCEPSSQAIVARSTRLARPAGLEPATAGLEGRCSIRLSYRRLWSNVYMVGVTGFEPVTYCSQSSCATRLRYTPSFSRLMVKISTRRVNGDWQRIRIFIAAPGINAISGRQIPAAQHEPPGADPHPARSRPAAKAATPA